MRRIAGLFTWQRAAVSLFVLTFLLVGASMLWTAHEVGVSQHRWCATLITLDDAARGHPPTTATGRRLFARITELAGEFGCR